MTIKKWLYKILLLVMVLGFVPPASVSASPTNGTISSGDKYAWGENVGWINFGTSGGNVHVTDSALTGYAWVPNYGWMNLAPSTSGVKNDSEGYLSGYAWGENLGWVDFSNVTIDVVGDFHGYATNPIAGSISFNCENGSGSCATQSFKVNTDWRPARARQTAIPLPKDLNPSSGSYVDTGSDDDSGDQDQYQEDGTATYVYRFWSDVFHGHFFTIDPAEYEQVKNNDPNWTYEGVAFNAYTTEQPDTIPLYRFWSDVFRGHFYTSDYEEYMHVKDNDPNWNYEWIAYYVYPLDYDGDVPTEVVYRFWSPVFLHHFYTADYDEMVRVRDTDSNWDYEGEAYRVPL